MRYYSIFVLLLFSFQTSKKDVLDSGFIKVCYSGDQTKMYPRILFYLPDSKEANVDSISTHKVKISPVGFDKLRKAILEEREVTNDSILRDSDVLQITISKNGETAIFLTPYVNKIRQIIREAINQLENSKSELQAKSALTEIAIRMRY
jgi:hypothetical protein